jgi:hypothetical protein
MKKLLCGYAHAEKLRSQRQSSTLAQIGNASSSDAQRRGEITIGHKGDIMPIYCEKCGCVRTSAGCLRCAGSADCYSRTSPKNTVAIKMLPWMCGNCGKHEVQNLRVYEGGPSFIATCDNCGSEWVS